MNKNLFGVVIISLLPLFLHGMEQPNDIFSAIESGNIEFVKNRLDQKANPNARNVNGLTLLQIAVHNSQPEIVQLLLDRGAKVDMRGVLDETPLLTLVRELRAREFALEMGFKTKKELSGVYAHAVQIAALLIKHGANATLMNEQDQTPLYIAMFCQSDPVVNAIIDSVRVPASDLDRLLSGCMAINRVSMQEGLRLPRDMKKLLRCAIDEDIIDEQLKRIGYTQLTPAQKELAAKWGYTQEVIRKKVRASIDAQMRKYKMPHIKIKK